MFQTEWGDVFFLPQPHEHNVLGRAIATPLLLHIDTNSAHL